MDNEILEEGLHLEVSLSDATNIMQIPLSRLMRLSNKDIVSDIREKGNGKDVTDYLIANDDKSLTLALALSYIKRNGDHDQKKFAIDKEEALSKIKDKAKKITDKNVKSINISYGMIRSIYNKYVSMRNKEEKIQKEEYVPFADFEKWCDLMESDYTDIDGNPVTLYEWSWPWEYRDYKKYIKKHVGGVRKGYNWLKKNLPIMFSDKSKFKNDSLRTMRRTIAKHDRSKYSKEEIKAYDNHFYHRDEVDPVQEKKDFSSAWNHHQKANPHHWQYWIITRGDGSSEALDMPEENIIEMICDWWSFSWSKNDLYDIFEFYASNKNSMILSTATRAELERLLSLIKSKLHEIKYKAGGPTDPSEIEKANKKSLNESVGSDAKLSLEFKPISDGALEKLKEACYEMGKIKRGAFFILLGKDNIFNNGSVIQEGESIDMDIDKKKILDMFIVGTPLHDGAAVILGDKIVKGAVFVEPTLSKMTGKFGARHQATLGISENSDAIAILVSEEKGDVEIAFNGKLEAVDEKDFSEKIKKYISIIEKNDGRGCVVVREITVPGDSLKIKGTIHDKKDGDVVQGKDAEIDGEAIVEPTKKQLKEEAAITSDKKDLTKETVFLNNTRTDYQDELHAIKGYEEHADTADKLGYHDAAKVLRDIADEEKVHTGELQKILNKYDAPLEKSVSDGEKEASEELEESKFGGTPNTKATAYVQGEMKKGRDVNEIINSPEFKRIVRETAPKPEEKDKSENLEDSMMFERSGYTTVKDTDGKNIAVKDYAVDGKTAIVNGEKHPLNDAGEVIDEVIDESLSVSYLNYLIENRLPSSPTKDPEFGIPEQEKFPLFDESHVRSAIKFFNYADSQYRKELARKIKSKMKTYGIPDSVVGKNNALRLYL